jgi:2'-hydroxyisoflavone reductase
VHGRQRGRRLFVWTDGRFLLEHEAGPSMELPLWIPEDRPEMAGRMPVSRDRALAAGLSFRPPADTIRATLDRQAACTPATDADSAGLGLRAAGMSPEREAALQAWKART